MMSEALLFFVHLATGALFSFVFVLCGKIKKTCITLFFVDFSLTLIAAAAFYLPRVFFAYGTVTLPALFAFFAGLILPRLFFGKKAEY